MPLSPRSTPRPEPHAKPEKLRETTTLRGRRAAAATALALLLAAAPAAAAPGRSETFPDSLRSAFAGLWERLAATPVGLAGLWEEIGTAIDPAGTPASAPQAVGTGAEPAGL
jgi:hypothetical protein